MVADSSKQRQTQYSSAGSSGDGQEVATAKVPALFRVVSGTATSGQPQAAASHTGRKWSAKLLHSVSAGALFCTGAICFLLRFMKNSFLITF